MKKKAKVSCIIPAYNEEKSVSRVIETCLKTPEIDEVIVVNDGSKDKTARQIEKFSKKVVFVNLKKNRGKGYAVAQGVKKARYSLLIFLDADLTNLKPHHIYSLIRPVVDNKADMTIGAFVTPQLPYYYLWPFSGQRCLRKKDIIPLIAEMEKTNYGLEIVLNEKLKKKRIIVIPIFFKDYDSFQMRKPEKQNDWLANYVKEAWEVFQQTISMKSSAYRKKMKAQLIDNLADYLKVSVKKIKKYLTEE